MKKLLSVMLAAIMTVSVFAVCAVPAMAADTVNSPTAGPVVDNEPTLMVNGVVTVTDITYTVTGTSVQSVTFRYTGEGSLVGWEHNLAELGLTESTDYTTVNNEDGSLTINFISAAANECWDNGEVTVNALVDFGDGVTATTAVAGSTQANDSSKAPATGMSTSLVAGSIAVACAGIAVLAATKKRTK